MLKPCVFEATVQRQRKQPEERTLQIFAVQERKKLPFAKPTPDPAAFILKQATLGRPTALRPKTGDSVAPEMLIPTDPADDETLNAYQLV